MHIQCLFGLFLVHTTLASFKICTVVSSRCVSQHGCSCVRTLHGDVFRLFSPSSADRPERWMLDWNGRGRDIYAFSVDVNRSRQSH